MKKTLLLNSTYEALSFIPDKRVFKFLAKDKVDVIASWDDYITWGSGKIKYPSVLKLKRYVKIDYFMAQFSRNALIKRDKHSCQYCAKKLLPFEITIDHILPRSHGGNTSFINCVVSCRTCNNKKADRTPEQANMPLIKEPIHPSFSNFCNLSEKNDVWNSDWDQFIIKYQ